jgi:exopolysaccharide biosynthesis WecB/TagA/CpsF family protein
MLSPDVLRSGDADPLPPLAEIDNQPVNISGLAHAVDAIVSRLASPGSFLVCTLNLDHLVKLRVHATLQQAYARAEMVTADGFPIVMLGRLNGKPIERAPGADLIEPLCKAAAERRLPVFLLGSTLRALAAGARRLVASYPGLEIAGIFAPPAKFDVRSPAADTAIELLRASGARVCFIALGAPLQEAFALRALDETRDVALLPIGGGLDFLAGTQIRSPVALRKLNLEWAWRLMHDPRRLWLRYLKCGILFSRLLLDALPRNIWRRMAAGQALRW